ncbi:MAG: MBL fold metallo-hydrolase [Polyangiales bacterium]|nr:MBL fold metallo-hydrolase [Sandaracinaceae bacterium]
MASKHKRLPTNVPGDFFVDSGCIDCGTCRWVAFGTFDGKNDQSYVREQPQGEQLAAALRAVVACPTGSIGTLEKHDLQPAIESFPLPIDPSEDTGVYHLGFHSRDSFGAASYLIVRERGNVMIDSPRFNKGLVERVQALGGVQTMFLTHRDDVADHDRYAAAFGATRILHKRDLRPHTRSVENLIEIAEPTPLDDELLMIPVPGHTQGSMCLLYKGRYLFAGDHLAWDILRKRLFSFKNACWYDWGQQITSTEALRAHAWEWVLPGHGPRGKASPEAMQQALEGCIAWMRKVA